ncbi:MAG: RNA polymerase sigma factor [Desulfomonilia bacterium]|jgi:RNA polymerase sigma-70 factor (ECF subfamily)|uniref:ECF RNA polymerase sigma factor SigW n=1 Tax=anaerobic digester metagenome TaxID=1263854 RepID=A0A485M2M7_9ZZZZ|nr:sigma-70 family RNA polymerase sigma factor [Pseudomonadota bacterium]HON37813.1 sigma-70 family RNA polymerase sigma factor [Deltaproteobacteria bacterium]HRS55704.1 sigma-70 family RNA polymerase sigma factor [Desulfomonilia bacterium]HPD20821.1 sigma-70 family RNA polymerase sigma factor [Deltaproteobacteria bacterium]HPX18362.1 sigma-70 family RNA polymerase sigma factor [Deltaproteobacteria bacterium]
MSKKREKQTDSDLVREVKQGDPAAMEEIVKRYSNKVYNLAYHLTRDAHAAEEIMQDVFLTVIAKIGTLTTEAYFSTWLYRVTTNAAYGYLRKEKKFSEQTPVEDIDQEQFLEYDWTNLPDDVLLSEESKEVLRRSIDSLPEAMRTVVVLKDVEGLKNEEIAETLGISVPAVKSRLHRGRLILRQLLSEYFSKYTEPSKEEE